MAASKRTQRTATFEPPRSINEGSRMTHPARHAQLTPDKLALQFVPSGRTLTYAELDQSANKVVRFLQSIGI